MARLISLVEDGHPALREVMALLAPDAGRAHVVGVTGAPGVGKSTTTNALVAAHRAAGHRVGVLAVDPSSPFSGGALLGDRIRMSDHAADPEVFIRSMASRGHLGGLSWAAPQALRVLDAAGCDVVLLETVGVGQDELDVMRVADTTLVIQAPGAGDDIQAAKAGLLECADVFAVNKADLPGADAVAENLRAMLALGHITGSAAWSASSRGHSAASLAGAVEQQLGAEAWEVPVVPCVATRNEGLPELVAQLEAHRSWLETSPRGRERRRRRLVEELHDRVREALVVEMLERHRGEIDAAAAQVELGALDPYAATRALIERWLEPGAAAPAEG